MHEGIDPGIVALMNNRGNGNNDGMFGMGGGGLFGGLILGSLLRNGNGGLFGGNGDGAGGAAAVSAINTNTKLDSIATAIPAAAANTQNSILQQTIELGNLNAATNLGLCNGFASAKDATQTAMLANLTATTGVKDAVQNSAFALAAAVQNDGDKTRALIQSVTDAQLNRELGVAQTALLEARLREHSTAASRGVEVNVAQSVAQNQQQQQFQAQFQTITGVLGSLVGELQAIKQGQVVFNSGTMTGSATQAAANTRVS